MKFTLSWLKEYLDTNATLDDICATLTNIGLEVEEVEDKSKALNYFSVAKIITATKHENSHKLQICQVQTADSKEPLQIICGAPNARAGLKVAYAPIGSVIPTNQMKIKKSKIAGVDSNGMLCSAAELGLGGESDGIIEMDEKHEIGSKITEIYGLDDVIIDINVTPNRGDCLGIYGIARDLAAAGIGTLKTPTITKIAGEFLSPIDAKITASDACQRAAFRYIKNVKNQASPKWLQDKLASLGMNSISAIVDVTNYVMIALNRPMHAYDADKLQGDIDVRFANQGEAFHSLKDEHYVLDEQDLVIADSKTAVGIAGIMGGNNASCDLETQNILLESAFFNPSVVATAGRRLNILSDSRYRFERGVDANSCIDGIDLATQLITEICGGQASEIIDLGSVAKEKEIDFDITTIKKLTGIDIASDKIKAILSQLNFQPEETAKTIFKVKIPSNRHDITIAQDLVEEVVRIYGYHEITPQKIDSSKIINADNKVRQIQSKLASQGMIETINWSFCDENIIELFDEKNPDLILANPISIEMNYMRPNLIIGLMNSYQKNYLRNFANLSLFEVGKIFAGTKEAEQKLMVAGIRAGKNKEQDHYQDQRDFDIFDVKKDFYDIVEIFGINADNLQINDSNLPKYYHPGRSARLQLGKNLIGYFGEIHPKITKKFGVKTKVNAFEIVIDHLPQTSNSHSRKSFKINDLPIVERDFAFIADNNQPIAQVIKSVKSCDKELIKEVDIFDIYSGKNIEEGKKSIALRVKIQASDKTLTSQEIDQISQKIIDQVSTKHQASLRA